jgi:hypothetical protein
MTTGASLFRQAPLNPFDAQRQVTAEKTALPNRRQEKARDGGKRAFKCFLEEPVNDNGANVKVV